MNPLNVTWLSVNASYSHSSMALPLLHASCLDLDNLRWSHVCTTINEKPGKVVECCLETQPDVILATAYLFTIEPLLSICARLKKLSPHTIIILGGPEFLGANEPFLIRHPSIDGVVRGEGELVIRDMFEHLHDRDAWSTIPGLAYRGSDGSIFDDGSFAKEPKASEIPNPMDSEFMDFGKAFVQLETSRGCTSKCTFCTSALSTGLRKLEVDAIRLQLDTARENDIQYIRLLDRTFNTPADRAEKLLALFIYEYPDLDFHLELYPNLLNDRMLKLCTHAEPGRLHLEVGLQSTHEAVLKACRRAAFSTQAQNNFKILCEAPNLTVHADLIVGLPAQTLESFLEDLDVLSQYTPGELQIEVLKLLKGTPLETQVERYGILHADNPPYEVLKTSTMSYEEITYAMQISKVVDQYYNHAEFHNFSKTLWRESPDFFVRLHKFLHGMIEVDTPLSQDKRYRLLHAFLADAGNPMVDDLEVLWIKNGHSLLKGLGKTSVFRGDVPQEALCIHFDAHHPQLRDSKTYLVDQSTCHRWLRIFRKSQSQIDIIGEWVLKK